MFCSNCGHPVEDGVKFCGNCGAPVEQPPEALATAAEAVAAVESEPAEALETAAEAVAAVEPEPAEALETAAEAVAAVEPEAAEAPVRAPEAAEAPVYTPEPAEAPEPAPEPKSRKALWIALGCAAVAVIAVLLLVFRPWSRCGAKTPEEAVRSSVEQMAALDSQHAELVEDIVLEVGINGMSMNMEVSATANADLQRNPEVNRIEMAMQMIGQKQEMLIYTEKDGDKLCVYASTDGGKHWEKTDGLSDLNDAGLSASTTSPLFLDSESLEKWKIRDLREDGTETVNGASATVYAGYIPAEYIKESSSFAEELLEGEDMAEFASLFDNLEDIPIRFWIDRQTGYLLRMQMDLQPTMQALLTAVMSMPQFDTGGMDLTYTVKAATIDCTFSQFNEVPPIVIPPEAKN